jgi:hypothetical protein
MTVIIENEDAVQYVLDAKGNKTAVLIPIELWNQRKEWTNPFEQEPVFSPKKYRGILKGKAFSGREEETTMRDEWL